MKKFAAALLAAALVAPLAAAPALAQPGHDQQGHDQQGHDQRGAQQGHNDQRGGGDYRSFRKGEKFDVSHARNYQQIDYRHYKRLKAPPRGYHYVRSGNDVLLITAAGIVAGVTTGVF